MENKIIETIKDLFENYEIVKKSGNQKQIRLMDEAITDARKRLNDLSKNRPELSNIIDETFRECDSANLESIIEEELHVKLLKKAEKFSWKRSKLVKGLLVGLTVIVPPAALASCTSSSKNIDPMSENSIQEDDKDYTSTNLINNGVNFATLIAQYNQYSGYSAEELAYMATEFTGHIPSPYTAEKFNMSLLISEGDAKKTIDHVKTTFDNMFQMGLEAEHKEKIVQLFGSENDKKIIGDALDIYFEVKSNPSSIEVKTKLIEELKDYNNQHNTATTDMANLLLVSIFDTSRGMTLLDNRVALDDQIDILTNAIINDVNVNVISKNFCSDSNEKSLDASVKNVIDEMIKNGLKAEDKETILNLITEENDKVVVEKALDIYLEVTKNPASVESRDKLIENLKDYKNQDETAVTTKANSILVPLYVSVRDFTLVGDPTEQFQQIDVLTNTVVEDYTKKKGIAEDSNTITNKSVYTNILNNLYSNHSDFINQAKQTANYKGTTTLDKNSKEIAAEIANGVKDLQNSTKDKDVTEVAANQYRERYDNTPADKARQKVSAADPIVVPEVGAPYIDGGKTSEDMSDKQLPNKDANGNDTDMGSEEMIDYATKAANDFNEKGQPDKNLYGINSIYTMVYNQLKAAQDANNPQFPNNPNVGDDTNVEYKPTDPIDKSDSNQNNNQENTNNGNTNTDNGNTNTGNGNTNTGNGNTNNGGSLAEGTEVPGDYVPPEAGTIVDKKDDVVIVPSTSKVEETKETTEEVKATEQTTVQSQAPVTDQDVIQAALTSYNMNDDNNWLYYTNENDAVSKIRS